MRLLNARLLVVILLTVLVNVSPTVAQRGKLKQLIEKFDEDGDGRLSLSERAAARKYIQELAGAKKTKTIPQKLFPGKAKLYKLEQGPYKFGVVETFDLKVPARKKTLPLRITYPLEQNKYPLIVWCHGALGSKDGNQPLVEHWVSHGYVVIQPTFGDSISLMTQDEKKKVKSIISLVNSPRVISQWDDRPQDVSHLLDSLDLLEEKIPALKGKIDHKKLGIAGHSFGAHTTMMICGMKLFNPFTGKPASYADDRFTAAVMISPQGLTKSVTKESYTEMKIPSLMITGDNDGSPMKGKENKAGEWRKKAFDLVPAGDKYLLWVKDAYHGFGGISGNKSFAGSGPISEDQVSIVKSTALAFFDAYLKQNQTARDYLHSSQLEKETGGAGEITTR